MVASQTDKALDLKKDFTTFETTVKLQLTEMQAKIQEQSNDIAAMKQKQVEMEVKVNSLSSSSAANQQNSTANNVTTFGGGGSTPSGKQIILSVRIVTLSNTE